MKGEDRLRTGEGVGRSLQVRLYREFKRKKGAKYLSSPEGGTTTPVAIGDGQVYQLEPVRYLGTRAGRDRDLRVVRAS
jgi:hypothetical protein